MGPKNGLDVELKGMAVPRGHQISGLKGMMLISSILGAAVSTSPKKV